MVLSFLSWLMVRPQTPDTCAARSQRQSTSSCGHGRRSTNKEKARSKALTDTPPGCTFPVSESAASIRRRISSWLASRGALWPLQRQHDCPRRGEAPVDPTCMRCEEGCAETFLHRHWLCAGNLFDHPNEAVKQAHQRLSRRAQTEAADTPCLWFRGLLPAEHTTGLLPPPASEETAMVFEAGGASTHGYLIRNHPPFWYADSSGGKYGHDARLVRAGWGAVGVSRKVPFPQRAAALGALCGPLLENCRALAVPKFGHSFRCWNVLWAIWSLVRTATTLSNAFGNAGGLAGVASRMATCGVESVLHSIGGVMSLSTRSGRRCWLLTLLMIWRLTRGKVSWAMNLLTPENGALLHEVLVDVVEAVREADSLVVRIQKQLYTMAIQAVPELRGSAKAPDTREARAPILEKLMASSSPRSSCGANGIALAAGNTVAHKHLREWAAARALCSAVVHGSSGPLSRWATCFDWLCSQRMALTEWRTSGGIWCVSRVDLVPPQQPGI